MAGMDAMVLYCMSGFSVHIHYTLIQYVWAKTQTYSMLVYLIHIRDNAGLLGKDSGYFWDIFYYYLTV